MRPKLFQILLPLCLLAALAACGDEVTTTTAAPAAAREQSLNPWEQLSPEEIYGATASENIRLTEVEIDVLHLPSGWDGMRIAAISDLQLGLWEDNERVAAAAVQRALAQEPDLIVLLGDYLAVGGDSEALLRALSGLRGKRVLAVMGGRDVRNDSVEARVRRTMSELGIQLLVNDAAAFERNGDTAWIAGLAPDLNQRSIADQEFIVAITGGPITTILLTHSPFGAARAPEGRRPVILAGNAFCGRVEVPGTPRISWYESEALPNAAVPGVDRLYRIRNNTMFITCGIGYSFIPVRLGAPPEVAMITLRGMMAARPPAEDAEAAALDTILQRYDVTETPPQAGQN